MKSKFIRTVSKFLISGILFSALLFFSSCDTWMSNDDFMSEIESEVHDANAEQISVYVRYANAKMGSTEPQGRTTMKVDVASKISAITSDDYGFVKWAAFSTNDFPPEKQHSALTYVSEEDYNENYKKKELPSSVIKFSNPNSISTDVKILSARNDIFIIPIVTTRPTYVQSVPANGRSAVVKNSSIRIRFSKAIDKKTLYDSEGACNISITSSPAVFTDDDNEMEAKDITEDFDFEFSPSGKMLTLTLKDDALLDNNSQITITIYEGLCDEYGFSMSKNYSFSFTTGTKTDSLAPMIEVLVGAKDDSGTVDTFVSYYNGAPDNKHNPQLEGKATDSSRAAGIDLTKYTDELYAQRVYDSLNIFVKANDIIGADQNVAHDSNTLSEENVAFIGLQATLFTNNNGDAPDTTKNGTKIEKKNYGYVPGSKDSGVTSKKLFTDIVPLDKDEKKYSGGTIYTYDLKDLEDGLIRIDVWAIDMVGNSGEWGAPGASYYKDHDNGFKSIFVIKDTTPIDSNTVKTQKKVVSNSEAAPYYWYNSQTLKTMLLFDKPENKITDSGHPKLRSLDENLFWTFAVGSENNIAPEASSNEWVRIHNATTGESIPFPLNNAVEPTKDGSVDITVFLKDDLGNVSKPVVLDSIMYDNTKPTVTLKSGKGDFVTATGVEDLHVSGTENKVIEQILKVTIDEKNVDNAGSGIRRIEIHVKKDGQEVAVPLDPTKFAVKYAPSSITNPTPASTGIIPVRIVPAGTDSSMAALDENKIKVFDVTDSNKITSGTLFVYGITLGDSDGTYKVEVDLYDSAMNKTPATAVTQISRDTTDPVISKVQVMDVASRKVYGQDEETWWLPYDRFEDANKLTKVTLKITANEAGSGLKYLKLAENAEFTENTKLYVGSELLTRDTDYKLNTATKTIELLDWYTPKLINANNGSHEITLENIKLNNLNAAADAAQGQGNKIKLTTDDFVGKTTDNANNIYYGDTAVTGTLVYADSVAPELTYLHIEDNTQNVTNNPDNKRFTGDKDNYTDSQIVDLTLKLGNTEIQNKGSGVNKVILSDNAVFTDSTQIYLDSNTTPLVKGSNGDYEITTENEKSVANFKKVFTETNTLKFTNVKIISSEQGNQLVKADVKDFAGIQSASKASNTIIYDTVKPEFYSVAWVADNNTITAGNTNTNVINNQTLQIDFTETTAGVRVIKLDITKTGETSSYATPFDSSSLILTYENEDPANVPNLTRGTDFTAAETDYITDGRYIILKKTYKTGIFNIKGITLNNTAAEDSYEVKVTLLDASENNNSSKEFIDIDTVAPEITESLNIPLLYRTVELTTSGHDATVDGYWISKDYVNGSNKAADKIPVYIKVKEKSSGLKVIEFASNAILTANTKLYTVSGSTQTLVDPSKYTVDTTANTITINRKEDARTIFAKKDSNDQPVEFELLVTDVGFNQTDTENAASSNTIKVILSDVAKNRDAAGKTQAQATLYSDSRTPAAPANLTLTDRSSLAERTAGETIGASVGYTNDSIVDMTFSLSDCEKTGSGYHKFVLTGATFKEVGSANAANATTNAADKTILTMKSGSADIQDFSWEISADGRTLTLKKSGQTDTDDYYAVVRQAVNVTINNVHLDNATTQGSHTVTLTAYDMTGWASDVSSTSIVLDTSIPTIEGNGPFVANYKVGTSPSYYYNPAINVYPHVSSDIETVYGTPVNSIPTFYTATSYSSSGVSQVNGQISLTSSAQYGVVLGFRVKDTYKVRGYNNTDYFMYYKADSTFSLTKKDILSSGSPLYYGSANRIAQSASYTAATTNYALWFGFTPGNYSAVVLDSAGNVSNVFRFSVVKDTTKPANTDLNERVLLQMPDSSAKAYKNGAVVTSDDFAFKAYNLSSSNSIRNKKYIIKKSQNGKYKIQLNLKGTYSANTPIEKIGGSAASTMDEYSDLFAKDGSAPIEKYAISTWYGNWPSTLESSYTYQPVVPYGTKFPSGQTHDSSSTALGRDYFGYTTNNYSSYWRAQSSYTSWHTYTKNSSRVTDSGNGISSYVDSNNNLIIEIPDDRKTAPISVFLQDGCGNINYVVCGLYKESGKDIAVSFITDTKLGYASTTNGQVSTPIIMQNPYMTYVTSSPSVAWPLKDSTSGFTWNKNTGNGSQSGEGQHRGFIKDYVKYATYYNPNIDYSDTDRQYKIGLTLNYDTESYQRGSPEDVLFDSKLGRIINPNPDSSDTSISDYSVRALLYCTQSSTKPTYEQIISAAANTKNTYGGFRTEWVGVRASNDDSQRDDSTEENPKYKETGITILLDYPKPDYTSLNWTTNETNGEPKPYYIWYIFEDRVGNYEIAKIVNSNASGTALTTTTSGMFDRWLYDNEKPKLTIRGTSTNPGTITAANIGQLVATNNGFVPYANNGTVYVHSNYDNSSVRSGGSKNTTIGKGTTLVVDGQDYESKTIYNPFFDLEVSERTGVRAFAWSTSNNVTFSTSTTDYYYYYSRTDNSWYVGWSSASLNKDIGDTWTYGSKPTNAYYGSGSNYSGKYSGVKVNTVVPYGKINSSESELWLHVIDWTGNISSYKMGSGLKFKDDSTAPDYSLSSFPGTTKTDEYYISKEQGYNPVVRIAGNGAKAKAGEPIKLYIPKTYYTESTESGSGIKGYTFSNGVSYAAFDTDGPYLNLTSNTYTSGGTITYKVYDNVGNYRERSFSLVYDATPPAIGSVSLVINQSDGAVNKFADPENGLGNKTGSDGVTHEDWPFDAFRDYSPKKKTGETTGYNKYHASLSDVPQEVIQTVYINKTGVAKFHVNIKSNENDTNDVIVNKWAENNPQNPTDSTWVPKWVELSSVSKNSSSWKYGSDKKTATTFSMGSENGNGYDLTYDTAGTYYQIVVTDLAGNTSCQYFKLYLDNQGPELVARTDSTSKTPTIELGKRSIGKEPSNGSDTYYYTAASGEELKINFAMKDAGLKNSKQKFWYSFDPAVVASTPDESKWIEITPSDDGATNVTARITSGDIEKIYFKDLLGNISTLTPGSGTNADFEGYKYNYGSNSKTMTKLTYWSGTPSTPSISFGDSGNIQTSDKYDNSGWDKTHTKKSDDYNTDKTIIITSKDRRQLKVEFTKDANEKIIGYLVTDGSGNAIKNSNYKESDNPYAAQSMLQEVLTSQLSAVPNSNIGAYNFSEGLPNTFNEWLPLLVNNGLNDAKEPVTRNYYAVDIVGNISQPLTVVYSYSDANHQATDIRLIKDYTNDGIQSDAKALIDADIAAGKIKLAKINNNNGTWFFNGDFLLLECTLKNKAVSTNNDIPNKVELRDIWGGEWAGEASRGSVSDTDNTNQNTVFKVYESDNKVSTGTSSGRYYCYVAFKITDDFFNNDQWGGSQLYAKIVGKSGAESEVASFNPDVSGADNKPRWKRDTTGPEITGSYLGTGGSANNVTKYTPSGTISIVYDKDSANSWTGKSNSYSSGLTIKIPAAGILDGIIYSGNSGSVNNGDFVNYSGIAQYRTLVTGTDGADSDWQSLVPSDDEYYTIPVPNVTSVHSEIKLWIRDSLGNTSKEYKIGGPTDANSAWWILNNCLTESGTTVTAPSAGWVANTDSVFDVTPPEGSIITSVTAKVGDADLDVKGISFNGYNGVPTVKINNEQTQVPMSDGWLNLSGLKVTVAPIAQDWNPQSVTITLNGTISKTISNFVPAKKLSPSNITLTQATWNPAGDAQTEYNVAITMNGSDNLSAPSIGKLENMTYVAYLGDTEMTNITVNFDQNNSKFIIKGAGIPTAKTWANQVIKIKISGDNIVEGGITLDAMTISPISADDIEIKQLVTSGDTEEEQTIEWNSATVNDETGERTFKLKFNCPTSIPEGTTISTNDVGSIEPINATTQTAILKVKKGWGEQPVNITIGSVTKEGVLTVPAIDADDITISSSPAAWASTTTNNEYTLTVGVKGDVTLKSTDFSVSNATISTAWNASTSTLKIKPVDQSWTTDQDVVVTVHNVVTPKILTVLKRTLVDGDITLGTPVKKDSRYEIGLTLDDVVKNNLASVSATNATTNEQISDSELRFNGQKKKIYFPYSALPVKLWNQQQLINLTITASNDSSITKTSVLTVEAIAADDIKIQFVKDGTPEDITSDTWNAVTADANGEKVFPLKITAPTALPQDCVVKYGEQTLSFDANDTTHSIVLLPLKQKVTSQTVSLTVNGITKDNVMTIPARSLAAGDITVSTATWSEGATSYELTISYFNGASKSNISSITTDSGVTVTLDTNKTKVTLKNVSKGWTQKEIQLKLNNSIDLGVVLTVPAKVPADYITVTPTTPAAFAENTTSVTFTVASSDSSLSITKVLYGETELAKSNNAYTITAAEGQTIAQDVTITIKTKHDDVETDVTKRIFPSGIANNFFGRAISINGMQEVYTFAETPKSVAAMQTRIIELPATVQKAWENFIAEKEEVAATVAPASQVVEPKKSSKKTSKKAAKKAAKAAGTLKAAESSAQPAAELEDLVVAAAEATGQTMDAAVSEAEASAKPAQIEAEASAPVMSGLEPAAGEASAEEAAPSKAALFLAMAVFCAAIAGIIIFCLKKKPAKK